MSSERRVIKAIVPVRSGSLRVQNKNTRSFCGSSLLEIRVRQLMEVRGLDGVCVSSNDPEMLDIATRLGAQTHRRDDYFASNTIPMSDVYENMASEIECDDVLYALVTTPLVRTESFESAIELYRDLPDGHDSVSAVADVKEFLLWDGKPLNYDPTSIPRSQDLPNITRLTFAISLLPRAVMLEKRSNLGHHPYFLKLDELESLDIDTPLEFEIAEWLYQRTVLDPATSSSLGSNTVEPR